MIKLSVILVVKDEAQTVEACLKSVSWADEIVVVVDSRSTDATEEIARKYATQFFVKEWLGYSGSKNFALSQANGEWVFWIDGDEVLSPELQAEIKQTVAAATNYAGFEIPRMAWFLGRWIRHCGWYPGHVLRLFRRNAAKFSDVLVHEGVELQGKIGQLKNPILHYTDRNTKNYFRKFDEFTALAAQQLAEKGKTVRVTDLLFRPLVLFVKMYFLKLGFLDGLQGLILSVLSANYVFVKYTRLWEYTKMKPPE